MPRLGIKDMIDSQDIIHERPNESGDDTYLKFEDTSQLRGDKGDDDEDSYADG